MPKPILYHNPRCSKSRQALAFMQDQDIEFSLVEYLKTPLTLAQLTSLLAALKNNQAVSSAHDMLRPKETEYSLAKLNKEASDAQIIEAIAEYPKLLERPILLHKRKAAIGRPLENIQELLND